MEKVIIVCPSKDNSLLELEAVRQLHEEDTEIVLVEKRFVAVGELAEYIRKNRAHLVYAKGNPEQVAQATLTDITFRIFSYDDFGNFISILHAYYHKVGENTLAKPDEKIFMCCMEEVWNLSGPVVKELPGLSNAASN